MLRGFQVFVVVSFPLQFVLELDCSVSIIEAAKKPHRLSIEANYLSGSGGSSALGGITSVIF